MLKNLKNKQDVEMKVKLLVVCGIGFKKQLHKKLENKLSNYFIEDLEMVKRLIQIV